MVGPLRVLVLLGMDGPSAVVRGTVYRPKLCGPRFDADFVPLYWPPLTTLRHRAAAPSHPLVRRALTAPVDVAVVTLRAALQRKVLASAGRYDRIILIKYFDSRFVRALRGATRATILYDLDDAMWLPEFLGQAEFERVLRLVDAVSCDNAYLRDGALPFNANTFILRGPVQTLPNAAHEPRPRPIVGWIGSHSTIHYLDNVIGPLRALAATLPAGLEFRVVGGGHDRSRWPQPSQGLAVTVIPHYDQAEMHRQLGELDVGVFPLNQDENSLGRGILKATIYMSAGVVTVCSAVGELPSFLSQGIDGFVCRDDRDWLTTLETLCRDPELRQRVGAAGRTRIARDFSLDHCFAVLDENFLSVESSNLLSVNPSKPASSRK